MKLTQERLKELLNYNPDNGLFTWKKSGKGRRADLTAGCKNNDGYLLIMVDRKLYLAHRLAWVYVYGEFPPEQIDHENHIRDDNRIVNLRCVTSQENHKNRSISSRNTSGFIGVSLYKRNDKWRAHIKIDGKDKYLGCFIDKEEAIKARKAANIKYGFHENHGGL